MIRKPENYDNVQINKTLDAGGFVLRIVATEYVPEKEYLKLFLDIAEGPYKNYFSSRTYNGTWASDATRYLSLKNNENAIKALKGDVTSIEKSNNFVWDWEEKSLTGKLVGGVFGRVQYKSNDGTLKWKTKLDRLRSVEAIVEGNFEIPAPKYYVEENTNTSSYLDDAKAIASFINKPLGNDIEISEDDLPF